MRILSVRDVLERLQISRAKLYYWEEVGKIPPARRTSTGKRFFLPADVERIEKKISNQQKNLQSAGRR